MNHHPDPSDDLAALFAEISATDHPGKFSDIDIARYLTGQMSDEERRHFDSVRAEHPNFDEEIKVREAIHAEMFSPEGLEAYEKGISAALGFGQPDIPKLLDRLTKALEKLQIGGLDPARATVLDPLVGKEVHFGALDAMIVRQQSTDSIGFRSARGAGELSCVAVLLPRSDSVPVNRQHVFDCAGPSDSLAEAAGGTDAHIFTQVDPSDFYLILVPREKSSPP